jgi:hypothetical protein
LDSSSASRAFSLLICSVSLLICAFSIFSLSVSASISSVPLKAEISHESRRPQTERQEAPPQGGDVEELGFGVSIEPQQSR